MWHIIYGFSLTHSPIGNFAEKPVLKLVERFSGHYRAIKSYNLPQSRLQVVHFVALIQTQNISLQSSGMRRKQNVEIFHSSLDFYFSLSLLFSLFVA